MKAEPHERGWVEVWGGTPVILALGWLRQENCFEFEALRSYIVSIKTSLSYSVRPPKHRGGRRGREEGGGDRGQAFQKPGVLLG